jgi:hypothetical protein
MIDARLDDGTLGDVAPGESRTFQGSYGEFAKRIVTGVAWWFSALLG